MKRIACALLLLTGCFLSGCFQIVPFAALSFDVVSSSIQDADVLDAGDTTIVVAFTAPPSSSTVDGSLVHVVKADGSDLLPVNARVVANTVELDVTLLSGRAYLLVIEESVTHARSSLKLGRTISIAFQTKAATSTPVEPPLTLVASTPANGAADIVAGSVGFCASLQFSRAVLVSSLTAQSLRVEAVGRVLGRQLQVSQDQTQVSLCLDESLPYSSTVQVIVAGVLPANGANTLTTAVSFTTSAARFLAAAEQLRPYDAMATQRDIHVAVAPLGHASVAWSEAYVDLTQPVTDVFYRNFDASSHLWSTVLKETLSLPGPRQIVPLGVAVGFPNPSWTVVSRNLSLPVLAASVRTVTSNSGTITLAETDPTDCRFFVSDSTGRVAAGDFSSPFFGLYIKRFDASLMSNPAQIRLDDVSLAVMSVSVPRYHRDAQFASNGDLWTAYTGSTAPLGVYVSRLRSGQTQIDGPPVRVLDFASDAKIAVAKSGDAAVIATQGSSTLFAHYNSASQTWGGSASLWSQACADKTLRSLGVDRWLAVCVMTSPYSIDARVISNAGIDVLPSINLDPTSTLVSKSSYFVYAGADQAGNALVSVVADANGANPTDALFGLYAKLTALTNTWSTSTSLPLAGAFAADMAFSPDGRALLGTIGPSGVFAHFYE